MLTRGHDRLMRQKTRLLNQIEITLKEFILVQLEALLTAVESYSEEVQCFFRLYADS